MSSESSQRTPSLGRKQSALTFAAGRGNLGSSGGPAGLHQPGFLKALTGMAIRRDVFLDFGPGRRIHCLEAGHGPDVVYFPANGGSVQDLHLLVDRIAAEHRFVGIDGPGREPTEWPDEPFSFFDDMPSVMDRALSEMQVGGHVAMGHSMGGMYALHHARRHPGEVRALVLFEGFVTLKIHYSNGRARGIPFVPNVTGSC